MRKTTILLLLVIFSGITFGQTLIDTNKIWNVVNCLNFGPCWTESHKFEGDTTLNGNLYNKLLASSDSTLSSWYYYGAFREDTTGKVYTFVDSEDILFYNFDLESGDDFILQWYGLNIALTVEQVDSITLLNGETRKRIKFDNNYGEEWIEGIGSIFGLPFVAYPQYSADLDHELNCFFENGELKYQNWNYDLCWYTTVGIEEKQTEQSWTITPNPFNKSCKIKSDNNLVNNYEVRILNNHGTELEIYSNNSPEMEIGGDLKSGFYIIQIFEKGILKQTGKLIKE